MNSYYCKKCDRNTVVVKAICFHCGGEVLCSGSKDARVSDLEILRSTLRKLEQGDRLLYHAGQMIQEVINDTKDAECTKASTVEKESTVDSIRESIVNPTDGGEKD